MTVDLEPRPRPPAAPVSEELVRAFADPLRARIVALPTEERLCTGHLVELTGARQTNVSNHLRLREAGVVETEPAGRFTYYRLRPEVLAALADHFTGLAERAGHTRQTRRPCG